MTTTTARRFSVHEYHRIAEVGIIHPEERVELIEGQIIQMAAKNPPHSATTNFQLSAYETHAILDFRFYILNQAG